MFNTSAIKVNLTNADIWAQFGEKNEMVINKMGRNLFPSMVYNIEGMEPMALYSMEIAMAENDGFKYKFIKNEWLAMSEEPSAGFLQSIQHPNGYQTGEAWMRGEVSFAHIKITSDEGTTAPNQIYLEARRKYLPVLYIRKLSSDGNSSEVLPGIAFPDTKFVAVTAYKNPLISDLKKLHNKHAGGVRTRKRTASPQEVSNENVPKRLCPIQESPILDGNNYSPPLCVPVPDFNNYVQHPPQNLQHDLSRQTSSNSSASSQYYPCNSEYNFSPEYCPPPPPQSQQQYFEHPAQLSNTEFVSYNPPVEPIVQQSYLDSYPLPQSVPPVQPMFENPPQNQYFEQTPQQKYEPKCYDTSQSFASQVANSNYYC